MQCFFPQESKFNANTLLCFYGIHVVPFCDSEAHKFKEGCVYMLLFCVCNILSTIFRVKKERQRKKNEKGDFFNVALCR